MRRSSRLGCKFLHLVGGTAQPAPTTRALSHGFCTAAGPSAAATHARSRQWVVALAATLSAGAGLQMASSSEDGGAQCRAAAAGAEQPASAAGEAGSGAVKKKTRVVVLGTGWGAISFLKSLDPKVYGPDGQYELTVVSPRSYFLYTPLLPSAAAGSVQERSIVEPVRNMLQGQGNYFQAECKGIDVAKRVLSCSYNKCQVCTTAEHEGKHTMEQDCFEVPYDILVVGVGSVNNTFGIKGVQDHCYFLKSVDDAHRLRVHISKVVEHAGLPHLTPEERRRHLNFVVVGGGPTGVELAAELHDLVTEDVTRLLPHLKDDISITIVDTMDHLLGALDRQLSEYTRSHFMREGIKVQLGTMVKRVDDGVLTVQRNGKEELMPFGTCVWATGVAMHPLVRGLREKFPVEVQNSRAGVMVDRCLRVRGSQGTIFAVGDCAVTTQDKALEKAAELFAAADVNQDHRLSKEEICDVLKKVRRRFPQTAELAALLEEGLLEKAARGMWGGTSGKLDRYARHLQRMEEGLTYEEFRELLADVDTLLRPLAPTAQVASQEGKYLANLFSTYNLGPEPVDQPLGPTADATAEGPAPAAAAAAAAPPQPSAARGWHFWRRGGSGGAAAAAAPAPAVPAAGDAHREVASIGVKVPLPADAPPFEYHHFGTFAYVGLDRAVLDLPAGGLFGPLKGWLVGLTWRSFETWGQVSTRNRLMVQSDWVRTKVFGRNISEV